MRQTIEQRTATLNAHLATLKGFEDAVRTAEAEAWAECRRVVGESRPDDAPGGGLAAIMSALAPVTAAVERHVGHQREMAKRFSGPRAKREAKAKTEPTTKASKKAPKP